MKLYAQASLFDKGDVHECMIQKATTMGAQLISEFYEIYFNVQYPVPKMEIVALPDAVGNNESPGLITFR